MIKIENSKNTNFFNMVLVPPFIGRCTELQNTGEGVFDNFPKFLVRWVVKITRGRELFLVFYQLHFHWKVFLKTFLRGSGLYTCSRAPPLFASDHWLVIGEVDTDGIFRHDTVNKLFSKFQIKTLLMIVIRNIALKINNCLNL